MRMSDNVARVQVIDGASAASIPVVYDAWIASLWGQRRWAIASRLTLETGLRLEGGSAVANAGAVRPLPRFQARFAADSQTSVSAGVGRAMQYVQSVGRTEWGRDALLMASPLWIVAAGDVPALVADIATLGVERWLGAAWLVNATVYGRQSTGYVLRDPRPGVAFARQLAVGRERASGLELSARRLAGRLTGSAGYTLSVARTHAGGLAFPSAQDRRHSMDLAMLLRVAPDAHLGAAYAFATGAPYTRVYTAMGRDAQGNWQLLPARADEPSAQRMPHHASLDLLFEWRFGRGTTRWTLFTQVRNALNRENPLVYLDHQPCGDEFPKWEPCGTDRFNAGVRRIPVIGFRVAF